ncbi:MAG: hypothetical protein WC479_12355 [Candidatus Izemoplasmatales bacterium]|jgi:hypothetical protein|nr:hypothetical protein KKB3_01418 [Dehalococcoides mccartyi]
MIEADRAEIILESELKLRNKFVADAWLIMDDAYPNGNVDTDTWWGIYVSLWFDYAKLN